MAGAKGIMDAILSGSKASATAAQARPDHATARLGLVAEMSEGNLKSRLQRLVDPALCRIWSGNARRYELLTQSDCQDLISGLLAQGKQEFPAIVRTVQGVEGIDYEVICGARRHWAISWLRANSYPDFKFLVEVRDMTDEEAFRLSDIENRDRADVSDYERAKTYLAALSQHYNGLQEQMAKRLEVTTSWLSRYLSLAKLPEEIVGCFNDVRDLGISAAAVLTPLLNNPVTGRALMAEARRLLAEDRTGMSKVDILKRLTSAARAPAVKKLPKIQLISSAQGAKMIEIKRTGQSLIDIRLHLKAGESLDSLLATLAKALQN